MPSAIVFDLFGVIALPQSPEAKRRIEEIAGVRPDVLWTPTGHSASLRCGAVERGVLGGVAELMGARVPPTSPP